MLAYVIEFLRDQPVLVFFLVLSLGYLVGNIRVAGIGLGSVGGVLLVGLFFGHLGFSMYAGAQTFGFAIFIFCVGYALTYLFGLIGLILVIRLLPRLLGIDLPAEAARLDGGEDPEATPDISGFSRRTYRVTREEFLDRSITDIEHAASKTITIMAIQRDGELIEFDHDTRPLLGDEIQVVGRTEVLLEHAPKWGEEISAQQTLNLPMEIARVVVTNSELVGKALRSLRLEQHVSVVLLQIRRQRQKLPYSDELELRRRDVFTSSN